MVALAAAVVTLGLLPPGAGAGRDGDDDDGGVVEKVREDVEEEVEDAGEQVESTVDQVESTADTQEPDTEQAAEPGSAGDHDSSQQQAGGPQPGAPPPSIRADTAEDPLTEPPMHGDNPHGQGTVGVIDVTPSNQRPLGGNPDGSNAGEEVVVGRSRGEQGGDGDYHGHITILAVLGAEVVGVDTDEGEQDSGPLAALQGVLDQVCTDSAGNLCLVLVKANSKTTNDSSRNRFEAVSLIVGGPTGIQVRVAESEGNIEEDGGCQEAEGTSRVTGISAGGQAVADFGRSRARSKACDGGASEQTNSSSVLALGGQGVPFPAAGCASGAKDTITGIPAVAPVVCNADDEGQVGDPSGVREALDVFVLQADGTPLVKVSGAASESHAQRPPGGGDGDGGGNGDDDDQPGAAALALQAAVGEARVTVTPGVAGPLGEVRGADRGGPAGAPRALGRRLPFTGAVVLPVAAAGLLLLAAGLLTRRRVAVADGDEHRRGPGGWLSVGLAGLLLAVVLLSRR